MARTACLVCFGSSVNGRRGRKKKKKKAYLPLRLALVAGTQQNLSSLYLLDVYGKVLPHWSFSRDATPMVGSLPCHKYQTRVEVH
jgi:hypothetical protein